MILRKIISGGQTGADQGALYAAEQFGLETGGWMPRGFRTDTGLRPDFAIRFKMSMTVSETYPARTLLNVLHSGGTLVFGNPNSPGSKLTRHYCTDSGRPMFLVGWRTGDGVYVHQGFLDWLVENKIQVLNVAGNRESANPGIFEATRKFLTLNIRRLRQASSQLPKYELSSNYSYIDQILAKSAPKYRKSSEG